MIIEKEKGHTVRQHDMPSQSIDCPQNMQAEYTTNEGICQGFTENTELEIKFAPKRVQSEILADTFSRLNFDKRALRVSECGTFLEFAHAIDRNGNISPSGKLHNANFCRDRLCPMCAWRRSYKIFAQVSQIMSLIKNDYDFLFLTLTIPNVPDSELSETLKKLQNGWSKLRRMKRFKNAVKGYFKALEITYNQKRDDYHPHYHIVLAVNNSYFNSRANDYIKRSDWLDMWRECMGDDTITQVDIRRMKSKYSDAELGASEDLSSAVAEVAKYAVKLDSNMLANPKVVKALASALHGKRLCDFDGKGAFGLARAKLKLDDAEDGDLIHIDDEKIEPCLALLIVRYGWSAGVYQMTTSFLKEYAK